MKKFLITLFVLVQFFVMAASAQSLYVGASSSGAGGFVSPGNGEFGFSVRGAVGAWNLLGPVGVRIDGSIGFSRTVTNNVFSSSFNLGLGVAGLAPFYSTDQSKAYAGLGFDLSFSGTAYTYGQLILGYEQRLLPNFALRAELAPVFPLYNFAAWYILLNVGLNYYF